MDGIPCDSRTTAKVILVGDSGVGKTCLISKYTTRKFAERSLPTVAPAFSCHEVRTPTGLSVVLQIWDTAGQERYSSISQLFFRDSDIAFICFDWRESTSVTNVEKWARRIRDEVPECVLFAVLMKADLLDDDCDAILMEAHTTLAEIGFDRVLATSALSGKGVEELFMAAGTMFDPKGRVIRPDVFSKDQEQRRRCC